MIGEGKNPAKPCSLGASSLPEQQAAFLVRCTPGRLSHSDQAVEPAAAVVVSTDIQTFLIICTRSHQQKLANSLQVLHGDCCAEMPQWYTTGAHTFIWPLQHRYVVPMTYYDYRQIIGQTRGVRQLQGWWSRLIKSSSSTRTECPGLSWSCLPSSRRDRSFDASSEQGLPNSSPRARRIYISKFNHIQNPWQSSRSTRIEVICEEIVHNSCAPTNHTIMALVRSRWHWTPLHLNKQTSEFVSQIGL